MTKGDEAMRIWMAAILLILTALVSVTPRGTGAQDGYQCSEFTKQRNAQGILDSVPDSAASLDPDGNGVACDAYVFPTTTAVAPPAGALSPDESLYVGSAKVLSDMYGATLNRNLALVRGAGISEWNDPAWQRQMLDVQAVVTALDSEAQTIDAPPRFADSDRELKLALSSAADAADYIRRGIMSGDISALSQADALQQEANAHMQRAADLLPRVGVEAP